MLKTLLYKTISHTKKQIVFYMKENAREDITIYIISILILI